MDNGVQTAVLSIQRKTTSSSIFQVRSVRLKAAQRQRLRRPILAWIKYHSRLTSEYRKPFVKGLLTKANSIIIYWKTLLTYALSTNPKYQQKAIESDLSDQKQTSKNGHYRCKKPRQSSKWFFNLHLKTISKCVL